MKYSVLAVMALVMMGIAKSASAQSSAEPQRAPYMRPAATQDSAPHTTPIPDVSERVAVKKIVKVGLLLPLTGRNAELGRAMQDAAAVALFDTYARLSLNQQATKLELLPFDTGDSVELARKAMQDALAGGVELVIGPIFADATEMGAPLAAAKNVPVLSFSNNKARAATPGTYLIGFSPEEQAKRVLRYAFEQNKKRIGVMVPESPLGDEVLAAARAVAKEGGKVTLVEARYSAQGMGIDAAVSKLNPAGSPPVDALLLAETGTTLHSVLRSLSARGITSANTQFLGTGMWDDNTLLAKVNLDGAWLASSTPAATTQFEARFRSTYNYTPPRVSSLAYDTVALAVTLATSGRAFTTQTLTNPRGFMGPANGLFRLHEAGTAERGLAVMQVKGGNLAVISPAPAAF